MHDGLPEVSDLTTADKILILYFFASFAPLSFLIARLVNNKVRGFVFNLEEYIVD